MCMALTLGLMVHRASFLNVPLTSGQVGAWDLVQVGRRTARVWEEAEPLKFTFLAKSWPRKNGRTQHSEWVVQKKGTETAE